MIIALSLTGLLVLLFIVGRINLNVRFTKEVKTLFARSKPIINKTFSYQQLAGLPQPVQRYFKLVLKEGQPYISYFKMKHDGQFKTGIDKGWIDIQGEQYATTETPGFIWKGSTAMFTARDMYIKDTGRLIVSLFSIYNVADGTGKEFDQGELLRWLGESVMYPTNLLLNDRLKWFAIDNLTAKLTFNYRGLSLFYIVYFNDAGEITQLETKRYMEKDHLETWIIKMGNYKTMNNINVPTAFEVLWRLKKGDFSYAKFNVKVIEFDEPYKF